MGNHIPKLALGVAAIVGVLVSNLTDNPKAINIEPAIRIEQPKDELDIWLDKLSKMENCPAEGILDTNKKMSYGCLCYQKTTFFVYTKLYNLLPEAEDQEYMNMIGDCDFQKVLARKMIEDNYNSWTHWWISVVKRGLGKPPKVH